MLRMTCIYDCNAKLHPHPPDKTTYLPWLDVVVVCYLCGSPTSHWVVEGIYYVQGSEALKLFKRLLSKYRQLSQHCFSSNFRTLGILY